MWKANKIAWLLIFVSSLAFAQGSSATLTDAKVETVERISIDGQFINQRVTSERQKKVVFIETATDTPLVEAYPKENPFPPIGISGNAGKFYADLGAGEYTIRIFDKLEGGQWISEYLTIKVPSESTEPDPVDPEPVDPEPKPDWSELTELVSKLAEIKKDEDTARRWAKALREIAPEILNQPDLSSARTLVGHKNAEVMQNRSSFDLSWNPAMSAISTYLVENPPTDLEAYSKSMLAVAAGLEKGLK